MKINARDMVLISMFAALTAIGAFIRIPITVVPFTLQFLFCAYSGVFLGSKKGLSSQLLYVGIGLIGIPIFTKGGGLSYIFQPTFGYLIGFILCSYTIGKLTENIRQVTFIKILISVLIGMSMLYLVGVAYLYMIMNVYFGKSMTVYVAIKTGVLSFIIPDIIFSIIISVTALRIIPIMRRLGYIKSVEKI